MSTQPAPGKRRPPVPPERKRAQGAARVARFRERTATVYVYCSSKEARQKAERALAESGSSLSLPAFLSVLVDEIAAGRLRPKKKG